MPRTTLRHWIAASVFGLGVLFTDSAPASEPTSNSTTGTIGCFQLNNILVAQAQHYCERDKQCNWWQSMGQWPSTPMQQSWEAINHGPLVLTKKDFQKGWDRSELNFLVGERIGIDFDQSSGQPRMKSEPIIFHEMKIRYRPGQIAKTAESENRHFAFDIVQSTVELSVELVGSVFDMILPPDEMVELPGTVEPKGHEPAILPIDEIAPQQLTTHGKRALSETLDPDLYAAYFEPAIRNHLPTTEDAPLFNPPMPLVDPNSDPHAHVAAHWEPLHDDCPGESRGNVRVTALLEPACQSEQTANENLDQIVNRLERNTPGCITPNGTTCTGWPVANQITVNSSIHASPEQPSVEATPATQPQVYQAPQFQAMMPIPGMTFAAPAQPIVVQSIAVPPPSSYAPAIAPQVISAAIPTCTPYPFSPVPYAVQSQHQGLAEPNKIKPESWSSLHEAAQQLEKLANMFEEQRLYGHADQLRQTASVYRQQARQLREQVETPSTMPAQYMQPQVVR